MYQAPLADMRVALAHMIDASRLAETEAFADATAETADAILAEAGKLAADALAPINRAGDLEGARIENGVVRAATGFPEAYQEIAAGGWVGMTAEPEHGGMGLPILFQSAVGEMFAGANMALSLCPLLSQGAIETLQNFGTPEQKAIYLPKLTSGVWNGTMNLTEPQAGSDVGALRTKAEPKGDGAYAITGSKIWITWGDSDCVENTVHLVLARLPGAPAGSRGISLFVVPKFLPNEDGEPGPRNAVQAVSLENKLGIHGSPTCVMAYDGAVGWLVGEENKGLACMFTMMNNARLGVGLQGVGVAEAATQKALSFARERVQGPTASPMGETSILGHADVRRMIIRMRALTQAARAICYECALNLDLAEAAATSEAREEASRMGAFLTPMAKAFGTDVGVEVAALDVQVHGGSGFVEETGAAQYLRDVRITPIYEGTNGIQAMDLVGRKLSMDGGETARRFLAAAEETAAALAEGPLSDVGAALGAATRAAQETTTWMLGAEQIDRAAGGVAYLRLLSLVGGGKALARAAAGTGTPSRASLARFYAATLLPETSALASAAQSGAAGLYALSAEDLMAA
ncbi:MAG: acyl-CoA dehydrogenase family protein [Pseudomonadota bacterium]